jgi:hypothetical protein
MNEKDKIIDKVRKLLELAKSDNVNEAGNAAAVAQELMSRHAISEAALNIKADADEDIEVDVLDAPTGSQLQTWKGHLGMAVCEVNQCKCFKTGPVLKIIGRPSDADKVRYLFSYIAREIDRLMIRESSLRGSPGRVWNNNFRLGAVAEVSKRLRKADNQARASMRKEADAGDSMGTGAALVRINNALTKIDEVRRNVTMYGKINLNLRKGTHSNSRYDAEGRSAGMRAGASIDLNNGGSRSIGSGARAQLKS